MVEDGEAEVAHADLVDVGEGEGEGQIDLVGRLAHAPALAAEVTGGAIDLRQMLLEIHG